MANTLFVEAFYTVREVAGVLKLSPRTIRRKMKHGELPPLHPVTRRFRGDQLRKVYEHGKPWRELKGN